MPPAKTKKERELILVVAGKEEFLVGAECEKLVGELLQPEQRTTGLFKADPAEVEASQVLDELRTLPFLTEKRVVLVVNGLEGHNLAVSFRRFYVYQAYSAPALRPVIIKARALAVAVFADREQTGLFFGNYHTDNTVFSTKFYTFDAPRDPSHRAHLILVEPYRHPGSCA